MSGGYFNYDQYRITEIAESVEQLILQEASTECTEWGPKSHGYSQETLMAFKHGLNALKLAAIYAQRIDWLVSCDDGEDSFHSRLRKDLSDHFAKPMTWHKENILKD